MSASQASLRTRVVQPAAVRIAIIIAIVALAVAGALAGLAGLAGLSAHSGPATHVAASVGDIHVGNGG
jgi:hypothetical protein